MGKFSDHVQQDTPRLVVQYKLVNGQEQFEWGVVGKLPIISLIGAIIRVQSELYTVDWAELCPESALVIAYDEVNKQFRWFIDRSIPIDSLCGMLEMIKLTVTSAHMARNMSQQQSILGPDGTPLRRF